MNCSFELRKAIHAGRIRKGDFFSYKRSICKLYNRTFQKDVSLMHEINHNTFVHITESTYLDHSRIIFDLHLRICMYY